MLFTLFLTVHLLGVRLRAFLPHNCVLAFLSPRLGWFRMRHKDAIPLTSRRCLTGPETYHTTLKCIKCCWLCLSMVHLTPGVIFTPGISLPLENFGQQRPGRVHMSAYIYDNAVREGSHDCRFVAPTRHTRDMICKNKNERCSDSSAGCGRNTWVAAVTIM